MTQAVEHSMRSVRRTRQLLRNDGDGLQQLPVAEGLPRFVAGRPRRVVLLELL